MTTTSISIPTGTRIKMIYMPNDPAAIPCGTLGTVLWVGTMQNHTQQVGVEWDNGRTLMLLLPIDRIEILTTAKGDEHDDPVTVDSVQAMLNHYEDIILETLDRQVDTVSIKAWEHDLREFQQHQEFILRACTHYLTTMEGTT